MTDINVTETNAIGEYVEQHGGDFLRKMMQDAVQKLMAAEADTLCNAAYGSRADERTNSRKG